MSCCVGRANGQGKAVDHECDCPVLLKEFHGWPGAVSNSSANVPQLRGSVVFDVEPGQEWLLTFGGRVCSSLTADARYRFFVNSLVQHQFNVQWRVGAVPSPPFSATVQWIVPAGQTTAFLQWDYYPTVVGQTAWFEDLVLVRELLR